MDKFEKLRELVNGADAFVFDFDGFIADSEKYHFKSYRDVFARYGHHIDENEYYKYWTSLGHGARGEVERHNLDLDPVAIRDEKRPMFSGYCEDGSITLFDEAHRFLDWFGNTGKVLAIASGSPSADIRAILRNAKRDDNFSAIVGSDMVPKIKPAPDVLLQTAADIGVTPDRCLVFEDAEKGVLAANAAGMPVIVVRTKETRDFEFAGADLILDSHPQFVELLEKIQPQD